MANPNPEPNSYDLEEIASQARSDVLENLTNFELSSSVEIPTDSVDLAIRIVLRYFEGELKGPEESAVKSRLITQVKLLLDKAINSLYDDFNGDEEFARFHKKGYLMVSNFVELCEIRKFSGSRFKRRSLTGLCALDYLSSIEEEYKNLKYYWVGVVESFTGLTASEDNDQRNDILLNIRGCLSRILESHDIGHDFVADIEVLHTLVNKYKRNIPAIIMKQLIVHPDVVAKVASIDTDVPATWLLNSFQPPVHDLRGRLARRVVGQDHVIYQIASVISRRQEHGSSSPLASFLLLPDSTLGVQELGESLAEALADGTYRGRFARFNFSKHIDPSSLNDVEDRRTHDLICRKLVQFLSRKPWCVFMIENVDKYKYAAEFLDDMLTKGKLIDAEGNSWELSNTVIIVTSSMGQDEFNAFSLKCKEIDCPTSPDTVPPHEMLLKNIRFISQKVDEVLVLNDVSTVDQDLITTLWAREIIDSSFESSKLILYPSDAFVKFMANSAKTLNQATRRYAMRAWFANTITPHLQKKLDGLSASIVDICCIDVLIKARKASFLLSELDERFQSAWRTFQSNLDPWKTAYQIEKRAAEAIFELRLVHTNLVSDGTNEVEDKVMQALARLNESLGCIILDSASTKNLEYGQLSVLLHLLEDVLDPTQPD